MGICEASLTFNLNDQILAGVIAYSVNHRINLLFLRLIYDTPLPLTKHPHIGEVTPLFLLIDFLIHLAIRDNKAFNQEVRQIIQCQPDIGPHHCLSKTSNSSIGNGLENR